MARQILLLAVLAASIGISSNAAGAAEATPPSLLTISGEGTATATPDIAVVSLGVVSEANTAKAALTANAADMNAAIDAITGAGIAKKDIGTSGLSVEPIYSDPSKAADGKIRVTGYRVQNQVTVTIRDIASSGTVLDKVVDAGANRVDGISFSIDKPQALQDQATKAAIADARRKAEMIAEAAGVTLGPIQSINVDEGGRPPVFRAQMAMKMDAMPAPAPVMPGEQEIRAGATIVYAIERK